MTVIAIDPGRSIGVAIHTGERNIVSSEENITVPDQYNTHVLHDPHELYSLITLCAPSLKTVVYEDFNTPGLISSDGIYTVRLIGAIECLCWKLGIRTILQFPPERKQFIHVARAMLKDANKKFEDHELDALAHLLVYEHRVRNGLLDKIMKRRRTV